MLFLLKQVSDLSLCTFACGAPQNIVCVSKWTLCPGRRGALNKAVYSRHEPSEWSGRPFIMATMTGHAFMFLASHENSSDSRSFVQNTLTKRVYEVYNAP